MVLSAQIKESLLKNWGEKADALNCYCEVKFIDPLSSWACYVYAMNPDNEDEIACMVYEHEHVEICDWSMNELMHTYNREGEYPEIDDEYRRKKASDLFKKLSEGI